jgi:hypothetical protein
MKSKIFQVFVFLVSAVLYGLVKQSLLPARSEAFFLTLRAFLLCFSALGPSPLLLVVVESVRWGDTDACPCRCPIGREPLSHPTCCRLPLPRISVCSLFVSFHSWATP